MRRGQRGDNGMLSAHVFVNQRTQAFEHRTKSPKEKRKALARARNKHARHSRRRNRG